jgi:hypothetical protein
MDRSARADPGLASKAFGVIMHEFLLYAGGGLTTLWGIAHVYPTRKVVQGFGRISQDSRLILAMVWIAEAILRSSLAFW